MWPYWFMYALPALAALSMEPGRKSLHWLPWLLIGLLFTLFIGYRFQVGGDWSSYLRMYQWEIGRAFLDPVSNDIGYILLNRLMIRLDWGIYGVNLVCALIFVSGLIVFCRAQYRSWLAFSLAVPYLVIVVGMGYTRQSAALGLVLFGLTYLERGKFLSYLLCIALATWFHKTALVMIPLGIFLYQQGWLFRITLAGIIAFVLWSFFMSSSAEQLWTVYIERQMYSRGAEVRVAMNGVAALCLFWYWKEWREIYPHALLWFWMALAALSSVFLVVQAPTAVDRLTLYLIPLQLAVFSRFPFLARRQLNPLRTIQWLLFGYGMVLFVWLYYADHAQSWLPYRNILMQ